MDGLPVLRQRHGGGDEHARGRVRAGAAPRGTRPIAAPDVVGGASPALHAFSPLIFVAWADGELAPEEIRILRKHAESVGLDEAYLARWLDPSAPPEPDELLDLLTSIRDRAAEIDPSERRTLVDLGLALAEAAGAGVSAEERDALTRVEDALGLGTQESTATLLDLGRPLRPLPEAIPAFDVDRMRAYLDGETREVRERIRALLSEPRFQSSGPMAPDAHREQVLVWLGHLADEGIGSLAFPEAQGGADDPAAFVAAFETLAYFDLSLLVKFGVQFGLFGGSIHQLGSREQHERYLRDVGLLALPGCFAMTETGHGSNVDDIETVATYDPETREFVVHTPNPLARKDYIGNAAAHGRLATVFAQLEVDGQRHGVHALLVPIRDEEGSPVPGVEIEDCGPKLGLPGVDNGRLSFDEVRVPRENLLDRFAWVNDNGVYRSPIVSPVRRFFTMLGTLVGGRIAVGSAAVTATSVALTIAVRYGARRRQFGPPGEPEWILLDYPAHRRRLLPRLALAYALAFSMHDLQRRYRTAGEDRRRLEADAAGLKAFATWFATDTIQTCREACGGQGYLAENRFAALKADTDVFTTFEGDNTVLLQLVAKDLLTGFQREFGSFSGIAKLVAERARNAVTDRNPLITRRKGEEHLRDAGVQLGLLEDRRADLTVSLARRVQARIEQGAGGFEALIACQDHALAAARAEVERLVIERMIAAERAAPSSSLTEQLERLRSLAALELIHRDRGWFLESGYLDASKSKAIRGLIERLCEEVREQAVPLVDALGVPEAVLEGTIAV